MSTIVSKAIGTSIVVVAAIAATIIVWRMQDSESALVASSASPTPERRLAPADVHVRIPVLSTRVDDDTGEDTNAGADLGLAYYCPSVGDTIAVQGSLSDECVGALERHYGNRETYDPVVPFKERLTWRQLFADPSGSKANALEALRSEECRVAPGTIREDLADVCTAGDLVRHALAISACNRARLDRSLRTVLRPGGLGEDLSSLTTLRDHESYWRRYRQIEDDHYRAAFTYSMCTQLPEDVVDLSAWELLTVEGATAEEILNSRYAQARDPHRASVDLLLEFAARLGNEWALENYVRDEGHIQALRRINPLLAILHRGRFEEWRRGREYDAAVQSLHDEAARDLERMKRGHDDPDELAEREQAIKERLWERQKELGDPYEADVRHTRLTHLYTAIAVATGYGIPFNTDEHIAGLDEITQEEWDAARESALALFRSEWWESG